MAKTFSEDLVEDFKNLYETKERYDTIITVGKQSNVESIHAHSVILCSRSSYFHRALSDEWAKRKDGYFVLSKPNISALTFNIILKFLYCGIVDLNSQKDEIILELLVAADELLIQKLTDFIQEFLIENSCKFLQQKILGVNENTKNEDINVLNKTLPGLIELIRFYQMDHKEFMPEVWKYRHLLSERLIEDILTCFLDSDTKPSYNPFLIRWSNFKVDSVLINKDIALLLTKWIDKKAIDDKTSKGFHYKFNLLFRSSLDGLSSQAFHQRCDNKGATITIAKTQNSVRLIGGYNPLDWNDKNVWKGTTKSFIFAFESNDLKNATVSRINHGNRNHAIACHEDSGPWFGEGPDLRVPDNSNIWQLKTKSYPKFTK
ncbi:38683_t:CDS:2, partial [Gigaspora margarita]